MNEEIHNSKKGKAIEYYIICELLKNDFDVYIPVVDLEGVDMIVRNKSGSYIEIQVKARAIKHKASEIYARYEQPKTNLLFVIYDTVKDDFWVIPSLVYNKYARKKIDSVGREQNIVLATDILSDDYYKNEKGIEFLKRALTDPHNVILSKLDLGGKKNGH